MNVAELIQKKYGILTRANQNPLRTALTTGVLMLLPNNPNRLAWVVCNLSDTNCYIAWDRDISAQHGILLTANGGVATMTMDEDFEATTWELFGLSDGVDKDIFSLSIEIVGPLGEGV